MILVLGALSPLNGGTTISLNELRQLLSSDNRFVFFDTSSINFNPVRQSVKLLSLVFRSSVVSIHISDRAAITFCPLIFIMSRILGKKFICRQFGGQFNLTYNNLSSVKKWLIRRSYLSSDIIYLQTKYLVNFFEPLASPNSIVRWLPTSRANPFNYCLIRKFHKKLKLVFIGRVVPEKGLYELACALEAREDMCLGVYGPCPDFGLLNRLRAVDNIEYYGEISRAEIGKVLVKSDIFVLPSYHEGEGYSGALVEALFSGIPLIVSRWNAFPEMFEEDEVFFVEPKSAESLADCLRYIGLNLDLLQKYSRKSYLAAARYELREVCNQFVEDHLKCAGY